MTKLDWDRVNLENLIARRGSEYLTENSKEAEIDEPTCPYCGVVVLRLSRHLKRKHDEKNPFQMRKAHERAKPTKQITARKARQSAERMRPHNRTESRKQETNSPLIGVWILTSMTKENHEQDVSTCDEVYGFLHYRTDSTVAETLMTKPKASIPHAYWLLTPKELKGLFGEYWSYQGKYRVNEKSKTVAHYITSTSGPSLFGRILERLYEMANNELVTVTKTDPPGRSKRLTWKRVADV